MLKVLIAEDDIIIADMIEDRLVLDGFIVCGIACNIAEAVSLAVQEKPDVAIVDVRLADGDLGTDLAVRLRELDGDLGILYATGNVEAVLGHSVGEACLRKPFKAAALAPALRLVVNKLRTGQLRCPVPDGLILLSAA
jgi:DNA-binding response OmpR family regulator